MLVLSVRTLNRFPIPELGLHGLVLPLLGAALIAEGIAEFLFRRWPRVGVTLGTATRLLVAVVAVASLARLVRS